jgi:hypothetical protein
MKATVVKIENIPAGKKSEDPVVRLDIDQHRLDRVTDENKNTQHSVHRIPRLRQ